MPRIDRSPHLAGLAAVLALVLGSVLAHAGGAGPAHAGALHGEGDCVKAYNFSDWDRDYLYASVEGKAHPSGPTCSWVQVSIMNPGESWDVGFIEGTVCGGTVRTSASATSGFAATSLVLASNQWVGPCSHHEGGFSPGNVESHVGMLFLL